MGCCCNKYLKIEKWLWNQVMTRGSKNSEIQARNSWLKLLVGIWSWKALLVRAQKEAKSMEAYAILENTYLIISSMLVEAWTLKALLLRTQREMRNMILGVGGKSTLGTQRRKAWLDSALQNEEGLPWWLRRYRICLQCRRPGFNPWRRAWQPTPIFLPGESPWTEQSMELQRVGHDWATQPSPTQLWRKWIL